MGCAGDLNIETPHLDALAARGVRFSNAYSNTPLCSPFRASLFTGQYSTTHGVISNHRPLLPVQPELPELVRNAGYFTSYRGKWHASGGCFGHHFVSPWFRPGWEDWIGWENSGKSHWDFEYAEQNSPKIHVAKEYMTDWLANSTIDFIQGRQENEQPWFHVVSIEPPHPPRRVPEIYWNQYKDREIVLRENIDPEHPKFGEYLLDLRQYYAQIKCVDDNVGRIVQTLKDTGQYDNTVIAYLSDHGDTLGSHGRQGKSRPEEESSGIPLLISGPGIEHKGTVSKALISGVDMMPTFLGLLDMEIPGSVEGSDLSRLLKDQTAEGAECAYLQYEHCGFPQKANSVWRTLCKNNWKYTWHLAEGEMQLFDIEKDPFELNNLVNDNSSKAVREELLAEMKQKAESINDKFFDRREAFLKGNNWEYLM